MPKYMIVTCFMLFWSFYEMSGGADFKPAERQIISAAPWETDRAASQIAQATAVVPAEIEVTQNTSPVYGVVLASFDGAVEAPVFPNDAVNDVAANVDLRIVAGTRVNMREGPSTDHRILDTLPRGTQAEVIAVNGDGWAQIRLVDSGARGWMAADLLSES